MATTLSFGYVKPQTGDKGSVFWPALEGNVQKVNDHTHNGTNSARLTSTSVVAVTATLAAEDWASEGGGTFSQTKAMPVGMNYVDYHISFRDADGHYLHPTIERASSTSYKVYVNNNTLVLTAVYT